LSTTHSSTVVQQDDDMKKSLWRGVKVVGLILWVSNIYDISSMRTTNIYHIEDVDICTSRLHYAMQIPS
jgi:hypothetical protein